MKLLCNNESCNIEITQRQSLCIISVKPNALIQKGRNKNIICWIFGKNIRSLKQANSFFQKEKNQILPFLTKRCKSCEERLENIYNKSKKFSHNSPVILQIFKEAVNWLRKIKSYINDSQDFELQVNKIHQENARFSLSIDPKFDIIELLNLQIKSDENLVSARAASKSFDFEELFYDPENYFMDTKLSKVEKPDKSFQAKQTTISSLFSDFRDSIFNFSCETSKNEINYLLMEFQESVSKFYGSDSYLWNLIRDKIFPQIIVKGFTSIKNEIPLTLDLKAKI